MQSNLKAASILLMRLHLGMLVALVHARCDCCAPPVPLAEESADDDTHNAGDGSVALLKKGNRDTAAAEDSDVHTTMSMSPEVHNSDADHATTRTDRSLLSASSSPPVLTKKNVTGDEGVEANAGTKLDGAFSGMLVRGGKVFSKKSDSTPAFRELEALRKLLAEQDMGEVKKKGGDTTSGLVAPSSMSRKTSSLDPLRTSGNSTIASDEGTDVDAVMRRATGVSVDQENDESPLSSGSSVVNADALKRTEERAIMLQALSLNKENSGDVQNADGDASYKFSGAEQKETGVRKSALLGKRSLAKLLEASPGGGKKTAVLSPRSEARNGRFRHLLLQEQEKRKMGEKTLGGSLGYQKETADEWKKRLVQNIMRKILQEEEQALR